MQNFEILAFNVTLEYSESVFTADVFNIYFKNIVFALCFMELCYGPRREILFGVHCGGFTGDLSVCGCNMRVTH